MHTEDNHLSPRGLERRLKRHFLKAEHTFLATTTPGFEKVLAQEIEKLDGVVRTELLKGGVEFTGPLQLVYSSNLKLRTANRILLRIDSFTARSYPELYNKIKRVPWELYLGFAKNFTLHCTSRNSRLHHTENISGSVAESITDNMVKLGVKSTFTDESPLKIHIRFADDVCHLSMDSSGDYLYKRGYRESTAHAPLRETTAASLLMLSGWQNIPVILDPMCGSGTFIIEAAQMSRRMAPGLTRRNFSFQFWPSFNDELWKRVLASAKEQVLQKSSKALLANDISPEAIEATKENSARAGVSESIVVSSNNALTIDRPDFETGLLISNLPYGKRVGEKRDLELLAGLGNHLRSRFSGWRFGFVTSERDFERLSGLEISSVLAFENGGIPVYFFCGKVGQHRNVQHKFVA